MKGEIRVAEFALANEPEDYIFTCTADTSAGTADAQAWQLWVPDSLGLACRPASPVSVHG